MAVDVRPGITNPSHDISLSDDAFTYGFKIENGTRGLREIPLVGVNKKPTRGGQEFGDFSEQQAHIQMKDWRGGRAVENHQSGNIHYYDARSMWTLSEEVLLPAPQWKYSDGYRADSYNMPGDVEWQALRGSSRFIAIPFTPDQNITADKAILLIRRVGTPPNAITLETQDNSAGNPDGTANNTISVAASTIADIHAEYVVFDWSSTETFTSGTQYWLVIDGGANATATDHWEIAVDADGATSKTGAANPPTTAAAFTAYHRVVDADISRQWFYFELAGATYKVDRQFDGTASTLYLNGWRGKATTGGTTTLADTNQSWTTDALIGFWVKFTVGPGKGEFRQITDNTATQITFDAIDETLTTSTEYVIYNTDKWNEITSTGLGEVTSVAVLNNVAYFAQGSGDNIRRMRWNSGTPGYDFADDSTNKADHLYALPDAADGPQMWRAENDTVDVSRADAAAWGTDLSFDTEIAVGADDYEIVWMTAYDRQLQVFKADGRYAIINDKANKLKPPLEFVSHPDNGVGAIEHDRYLVIPWAGYGLLRLYGGTIDDIGPNRRAGLPSGRSGSIISMVSHPGGLISALNAGRNGTSSVMIFEDSMQGWHEIFRAPVSGAQVRTIYVESHPGVNLRLWISCGSDSLYMDMPKIGESPLQDSSLNYMHEGVIQTSTIFMGAHQLAKYFDVLDLATKSLGANADIQVRYQLDDNIGLTGYANWLPLGTFSASPFETLNINESDKRKIRFEMIFRTEDADVPAVLYALILEGFARTPLSYQYDMRVIASSVGVDRRGRKDADPINVAKWLKEKARSADVVRMRTTDEISDDIDVVVLPPTILRNYRFGKDEIGLAINLSLQEANSSV